MKNLLILVIVLPAHENIGWKDWARAPQRLNCLLLPVERLQFDRFVLILLIYLKFYEKKPGSGSWPLFKACQGKFYNQQQNSNL